MMGQSRGALQAPALPGGSTEAFAVATSQGSSFLSQGPPQPSAPPAPSQVLPLNAFPDQHPAPARGVVSQVGEDQR